MALTITPGKDLVVKLAATHDRRGFAFRLKGDHILVTTESRKPEGEYTPRSSADWYEALNDEEKVEVFNYILAQYRLPSLHTQKWKVSSIGVYRNPDKDVPMEQRHLLYVGVNSDYRASEIVKDCAEQYTLRNAGNSMSQYQYHHRGIELVRRPYPIEMHVEGGREADPKKVGDKGQNRISLCGGCTDTCGVHMPPECNVFIYPVNNGNMPLEVDTNSQTLGDVKGNKVWKTTIGHLNAFRTMELNPDDAQAQRDALDRLIVDLMNPPAAPSEKVLERMRYNKIHHIRSIEELDVATVDGKTDIAAINDHFYSMILDALRTRKNDANIPNDRKQIRKWLEKCNMLIDASIMQYDDSTFTAGLEPSRKEKALHNSALSAVGSVDGIIKDGDSVIRHYWSMNFSMSDIANGITTLPSKDAIERTVKRSDMKLALHHIPFIGGGLEAHRVLELSRPYSPSLAQQYPGGFMGSGMRAMGKSAQVR